jgi:hypothetical protein
MMTNSNSPNPAHLSRRQALKAATAIGGALAASTMLPDKWTKPVIGTGVLPAHAQVSPPPLICPDRMTCEVFFQGEPLQPPINRGPYQATAQIYPASAGIPLHLEIVYSHVMHSAVVQMHDITTDASGAASLDITLDYYAEGSGNDFNWSVSLADCQLTCTNSYHNPEFPDQARPQTLGVMPGSMSGVV